MEYVSFEGWLLIGLAVFLILAGIASAIHVMWKYKPEFFQPTEWVEDSMVAVLPFDDEILDDIMDDD